MLRCWKFLLLIFKVAQRKNYAIEALNLLSQTTFFFHIVNFFGVAQLTPMVFLVEMYLGIYSLNI
jgi:hypothetical protein